MVIWSSLVPYGPVWSDTVPYRLVRSCMVLYGPLCSCGVLLGPVQFHIVKYIPLWSCMVPYCSVWSPMVLYGPVWSCMVPYDHLWSCMVFEILSSPIALLSPESYKILADFVSLADNISFFIMISETISKCQLFKHIQHIYKTDMKQNCSEGLL